MFRLACIRAASTGRISVQFNIGEFYENLSKSSNLKADTNPAHYQTPVCHIVGNDTFCAIINITRCCVSVATLSTFIVNSDIRPSITVAQASYNVSLYLSGLSWPLLLRVSLVATASSSGCQFTLPFSIVGSLNKS